MLHTCFMNKFLELASAKVSKNTVNGKGSIPDGHSFFKLSTEWAYSDESNAHSVNKIT